MIKIILSTSDQDNLDSEEQLQMLSKLVDAVEWEEPVALHLNDPINSVATLFTDGARLHIEDIDGFHDFIDAYEMLHTNLVDGDYVEADCMPPTWEDLIQKIDPQPFLQALEALMPRNLPKDLRPLFQTLKP